MIELILYKILGVGIIYVCSIVYVKYREDITWFDAFKTVMFFYTIIILLLLGLWLLLR